MLGSDNAARCRALRGFENESIDHIRVDLSRIFNSLLEATDNNNADLNGHESRVTIVAYSGTNALLRHGTFRVSANRRYFEHADATPFYWLGDLWWGGLSDRLSWDAFQILTADRKAKGFTVVQMCAGLAPRTRKWHPSIPAFPMKAAMSGIAISSTSIRNTSTMRIGVSNISSTRGLFLPWLADGTFNVRQAYAQYATGACIHSSCGERR